MGRRARHTFPFQSSCRAADNSVRYWSGLRGTAARIVYRAGSRKRIPFTTKVNRALVTRWARRSGAFSLCSRLQRRGQPASISIGGVHNRRASDDKAYTPIARSGDRYRATPLYYSMLMFAQVARGALVPTQLAPDTSGLKAFAVRAPEGTLRVCLINQNITHNERLAIDPGRKFTAASMLRLTGPAIDATAGVTLGGASVDEFERWAPPMNEEVRLTGRRDPCRRAGGQCRAGIVARVISFQPMGNKFGSSGGGVALVEDRDLATKRGSSDLERPDARLAALGVVWQDETVERNRQSRSRLTKALPHTFPSVVQSHAYRRRRA